MVRPRNGVIATAVAQLQSAAIAVVRKVLHMDHEIRVRRVHKSAMNVTRAIALPTTRRL
jgi:hypothetical protein